MLSAWTEIHWQRLKVRCLTSDKKWTFRFQKVREFHSKCPTMYLQGLYIQIKSVAMIVMDKEVVTIIYSYSLWQTPTNDTPAHGFTLQRIILPFQIRHLFAAQFFKTVKYS
jgi:hypothetical protein